jgi:hypothetical protein
MLLCVKRMLCLAGLIRVGSLSYSTAYFSAVTQQDLLVAHCGAITPDGLWASAHLFFFSRALCCFTMDCRATTGMTLILG